MGDHIGSSDAHGSGNVPKPLPNPSWFHPVDSSSSSTSSHCNVPASTPAISSTISLNNLDLPPFDERQNLSSWTVTCELCFEL